MLVSPQKLERERYEVRSWEAQVRDVGGPSDNSNLGKWTAGDTDS